MDCASCNSTIPEVSKPMLLYVATSDTVTGRDGLVRKLATPLVEVNNRGRGGWKVTLDVNGHRMDFDGDNPHTVANAVRKRFADNGIRIEDNDLWLNLNLQWAERAVAKRQMVTVANLMEVAAPSDAPRPERPANARQNIPPKVWGRKGWGMLQMYLAKDTYDYGVLVMLATELSTWVDPVKSPSIGCAECHQHFQIALAELRKTPLYTQREGREWLVRTMNKVNVTKSVSPFSYEQAAKANHWQ